ncbi:hypothetical protein L5515_002570 [Caenorhabditis briggsae]|uniref:Uncharacterized protein n=1 Tax=Caenorhabditis briggsae TaxID=6238 RepID=A0AAE9E6V2_CAEBR|nr:hypothetical protein L5515_002570 [Caenorhabditis briggsae]
MHRPFRCPYFCTTAILGGATLLAVIYYFYWRPKKDLGVSGTPTPSEVPPTSSESGASASDATSGEKRTGAGKETMDIFNFEDENVRRVCEKLFTEQMDMGEAYLEDSETLELGAMHMSNAIALTGETTQLLKVLRGSFSPSTFAAIQKYLPTAELRVNQLLQDELAMETIDMHFG